MLEICIVGFGALGTIYGYVLEHSGKVKVTAVCRSNYEVLKDRGVNIRSGKFGSIDGWKPSRVVKTVEEASDRQYDYVICTTKFLPDVIPTSKLLGSLLHHTSTIVLIQNGIGVEVDVMKVAPAVTVISGCAWIYATVVDGGRTVTHGAVDRLVLGLHHPLPVADETVTTASESKARLNLFVEVFCAGGGGGSTTDNMEAQRWHKNLWNIGYSVICTLTRVSMAVVLSDKWSPVTVPVVRGFMEEEVAVARAAGITPDIFPDSSIDLATRQSHEIYAETYAPRAQSPYTPPHFKPSMLVDLEAERAIEVEGIIGVVVKQAKELGVHVPRLETAYASLALLQEQLLQNNRIRGAV